MFHKHKWNIVGARNFLLTDDWGGRTNMTRLLKVCIECGKHKTQDLKGTWDLEQLNRKE